MPVSALQCLLVFWDSSPAAEVCLSRPESLQTVPPLALFLAASSCQQHINAIYSIILITQHKNNITNITIKTVHQGDRYDLCTTLITRIICLDTMWRWQLVSKVTDMYVWQNCYMHTKLNKPMLWPFFRYTSVSRLIHTVFFFFT